MGLSGTSLQVTGVINQHTFFWGAPPRSLVEIQPGNHPMFGSKWWPPMDLKLGPPERWQYLVMFRDFPHPKADENNKTKDNQPMAGSREFSFSHRTGMMIPNNYPPVSSKMACWWKSPKFRLMIFPARNFHLGRRRPWVPDSQPGHNLISQSYPRWWLSLQFQFEPHLGGCNSLVSWGHLFSIWL